MKQVYIVIDPYLLPSIDDINDEAKHPVFGCIPRQVVFDHPLKVYENLADAKTEAEISRSYFTVGELVE